MLRKLMFAMVALLIGVGIMLADEVKGKVKKIEKADKATKVTVTVDGKDVEFTYQKGVKFFDGDKEVDFKDKDARTAFLKERYKEGADVTIVYDKDGDKKTVKEIKVKK
jgi:ABC-type transport system substrate-binding protein